MSRRSDVAYPVHLASCLRCRDLVRAREDLRGWTFWNLIYMERNYVRQRLPECRMQGFGLPEGNIHFDCKAFEWTRDVPRREPTRVELLAQLFGERNTRRQAKD